MDVISPDQIWQTTLGELQLQLTGATFDTWLLRTKLVSFENDEFVIGVHNSHAQDWLSNRMDGMIVRTLSSVAGKPVRVKFVVFSSPHLTMNSSAVEKPVGAAPAAELEASEAAVTLPEMPDLKDVGYFPVSRYECTFWAPLLGRVAWRVWEIVRGNDIRKDKTDWTPERRWSAPEMARLVPCGPQAIVGVNRTGSRQAGALDRLSREGIGKYRRQGAEHDPHTMYVISVRVRMPLIEPVSVMRLTDTLRHRHDQWLDEHGFDPRDWFVDGERDEKQDSNL